MKIQLDLAGGNSGCEMEKSSCRRVFLKNFLV